MNRRSEVLVKPLVDPNLANHIMILPGAGDASCPLGGKVMSFRDLSSLGVNVS
jgi:hypothetical protein